MDFINRLSSFYLNNQTAVNAFAAVLLIAAVVFFFARSKKRRGPGASETGVAGGPAAAKHEDVEELKTLSDKYMREEDFEKAVEVFKKLIAGDKAGNLRDYYCGLLRAYYKLSMHEDAVEIFRIAIELKAGYIDGILPLVTEYFEESLKRGGKKIILLYGDCVISAYVKQKNYQSAIGVIDKILAAQPKLTTFLKRKAFLMLESGDMKAALPVFTELYKAYPDDERIQREYCRALRQCGRVEEASPVLLDAFKRGGDIGKLLELFDEISMVMLSENKTGPLVELAASVYKICGANICLRALAEAYLKNGDLDRANDIFLKAMKKEPADLEAAKRQKYVQTLVEEREALSARSAGDLEVSLTIDGKPVRVKGPVECDSATTVQVVDQYKLHMANAELFYGKSEFKKAITEYQNASKTAVKADDSVFISLRLMECFYRENMNTAAEKVFRSIDFKSSGPGGAELKNKYKAAGILLANGALSHAESLLFDIAAVDISYENVSELIKTVKDRKKELSEKASDGLNGTQDDSERTMIAAAPSEADYINNRYHIVKAIGKGGMGVVYMASDTEGKRDVAIKIPILKFKGDQNFLKRFEREADILKMLDHPNVLKVYDVAGGELPYMVMELLTGVSLRQKLREKKFLAHTETRDIALQCCDALEYTHGRNIIHRDIKPENIMLVNDNTVKIMDFGLSKALDGSAITKSGTIVGTFAYISPEQCLGDPLDGRADIYSLGIMFYEMLTGEKPFTSGDIVDQHIKARPAAPTIKKPGIPYPVEIIVMKCLEKKPQDRFATAGDLKAAWLKIV